MASTDVSTLLKVSELKKAIKNRFTAKKLQDQGLQRDLTQIYKPLAESQTKNTDDIITHLSKLSNENNKKIIDFKDTFKNFPQLIDLIDQVKSLLDIKSTQIINMLKTNYSPDIAYDIAELDHDTREFHDALSDMSEDTGVDTLTTDQSIGAISKIPKKIRPDSSKAKEYAEKQAYVKQTLEAEKSQADTSYSFTLAAAESNKWKESLKHILSDQDYKNDLIRYVELYPNTVNLRNNPWRRIGAVNGEFFDQLKTVKHSKTGKGLASVQFLPGNKKDLVRELFRLMGSYKSGNKNVYNELNAVVDQLRRQGVLSIDQSKQIYKTIS